MIDGYNDVKHNTKAENVKLEQIIDKEKELNKYILNSKKRQEIKGQIDNLKKNISK